MHKLKLAITLLLVCACTSGGGTAVQESGEGNVRVHIVAPGDRGILGVAIVGVDLGSNEYSLDDQIPPADRSPFTPGICVAPLPDGG